MSARPDPVVHRAPTPAPGRGADSAALHAFLSRAARRLMLIGAAEGAAAGLVVAALISLALWWGRGRVAQTVIAGLALATLGILARAPWWSRRPARVASVVERRASASRNIVLTATELMMQPTPMRADVRARVFRDADRVISGLDPTRLFPAGRPLAMLAAGVLLWVIALLLVSPRIAAPDAAPVVAGESVSIDAVAVTVTPPPYTGRPAQTLRNPARLEVLAGSRVRVAAEGRAAAMRIETLAGSQPLVASADRRWTGEIVADADGFIAFEAVGSDSVPAARRLVGLTVLPDHPPRVRVTAPGRDLFLPEARGTLDVTVEADDDLALASLKLRYTKVSGSGERFTFTEGETPLTVSRQSSQAWTARGTLPLGALQLGQGDVIVYRGVAADRRPGAPPIESDAFLVEITSPGAVASEGFAADDEIDRNAVSQQMVILKTQRLIARQSSMTAEAVTEEARILAAEQRRVRAEFVFMMGGELAEEVTGATGISELNEEEEAEAGDDILAGRLANRGRIELVRAIRSMSQADAQLTAVDLAAALKEELTALEHLQNAFSRTRYILRALTQRERLDLTRRLTGALADASRDVRPIPETAADPRTVALRGALAGIASLAGSVASENARQDAPARASTLAQALLRVDPSSVPIQEIAERLAAAGTAITERRTADARDLLDRAATDLAAIIRAALVDAPADARSLQLRRLEGALGDARRGATRE